MKTLIAHMQSFAQVFKSASYFGADKIILIADQDEAPEQKKEIEFIKKSLGRVIDIEIKQTNTYNLISMIKTTKNAIDQNPNRIYIDITAKQSHCSIGMLVAAYSSKKKIESIICANKQEIIQIPNSSYNISDAQRTIIEKIGSEKYSTRTQIAKSMDVSRAMLYTNMTKLIDMNLAYETEKEQLKITEIGRIAIMGVDEE